MPISLFRTHRTWLTEDQLLLLDVVFRYGTEFSLLRRTGFREQWNCQPHKLDNDQLRCNLRWLCEHGVLTAEREERKTWFRMTASGGELWSQERCPVWERFCWETYKTTSRDRTLMSVVAVSSQVRDEFLALRSPDLARRRTFNLAGNHCLLGWRLFRPLFVGLATYEEDCLAWLETRQQIEQIESQRTWWRSVYELQRFIPKTA